jgi:hypothetical protein
MIIALCGMLLQGAAPAPAAQDGAIWSVAGREVLHLRVGFANMTPRRRVEELDERLNDILSKADGPLQASEIVLKKDKGTLTITVRGDLLVTVTAEDAAANHMKPEKLGRIWLSNIRKTVPQLSPKENRRGA